MKPEELTPEQNKAIEEKAKELIDSGVVHPKDAGLMAAIELGFVDGDTYEE